jgi:hypothetical protein
MREFFARHDLASECIKNKYKSAAAAFYRDRIRAVKEGEEGPSENSIGDYDRVAEWRPGMASEAVKPASADRRAKPMTAAGSTMGGTGVTFDSTGDSAMAAVSDT